MRKYKLIKLLSKNQKYTIGLYSDRDGNKFVIKSIAGDGSIITRKLLLNEFTMVNILSQKYNKILHFPKVKEFIKNDKSMYIVYEYIKGKVLTKHDNNYQLKVINKLLLELKSMTNLLNDEDRKKIKIHNKLFYMSSLPILYFFAILNNYKHINIITLAFKKCIFSFKELVKSPLTLTHRDIKPDNIIIKNKEIYLLDCEQMVLTYSEYDINKIYLDHNGMHINSHTLNVVLMNYICLSYCSSFGKRSLYSNKYIKMLYKINN